jgi:cytochrome c551/c552
VPVARLLLLAAVAVVAAGCSDSVPGGKVVSPTPETVIGAVAEPWTGGNAAGGPAVFVSAGCGACHTFTPAHATGKVGPDLDELAAYAKHASQDSLPEYIYNAIAAPPAPYVPSGFPTNVMPTTFGQTLKAKQLADLVAFLAKGP